jgi:hypothetical protein
LGGRFGSATSLHDLAATWITCMSTFIEGVQVQQQPVHRGIQMHRLFGDLLAEGNQLFAHVSL